MIKLKNVSKFYYNKGIILTSYVLKELIKISYISRKFIVNPKTIIYSIIGLYLFNLVIGLLPVFRTLRKRPAQILSRTDIYKRFFLFFYLEVKKNLC